MRTQASFLRLLYVLLLVSTINLNLYGQSEVLSEERKGQIELAEQIRKKYERRSYQLKPSKAGHMGLRLWRNYEDDRYQYLLLQGILYTSNSLDRLSKIVFDEESLENYVAKKNKSFSTNTIKKRRRKATLKNYPYYRVMAVKILRHLARLDELGLRHKDHNRFITLLKAYDFEKVFTDSKMIESWGAQLANQVYWLHNLGLGDYRLVFKEAVRSTYPDQLDAKLTKQQYENKIYTWTHVLIADSDYYRYLLDYQEHKKVVDYFRSQTDQILHRCKEDVVIEVGLSLLLVNEGYPEIKKIRSFIAERVDPQKDMILSTNGKASFAKGEHRNIIAVLLLDWKGCSPIPSSKDVQSLNTYFPKSLSWKTVSAVEFN